MDIDHNILGQLDHDSSFPATRKKVRIIIQLKLKLKVLTHVNICLVRNYITRLISFIKIRQAKSLKEGRDMQVFFMNLLIMNI